MPHSSPQTYSDIDWGSMRSNALKKKGWKSKGPEDWDKKAQSFSDRVKDSKYIDLFLPHLPLSPEMSVLDIGSGPGTLSLPIAQQVKKVTAVDYSQGMLNIITNACKEQERTNIKTIKCAWEDNWQEKGIVPHDIAIASRSTGVKNLRAALDKINNYARQYVFISDRIGATPFEPSAFQAIGRSTNTGPDYIYTINTLYSMGIHPNINVLELDRDTTFPSIEDALQAYRWMFHDITVDETGKLREYIQSKIIHSNSNGLTIRRDDPPKWALIWWHKKDHTDMSSTII